VKVNVILADMGQNDPSGKLNILGAGWSVTGVQANGLSPNSALAIFIEVPWDKCNRELELVIELLSEDGEPVMLPLPEGLQPLRIAHKVVITTPPGAPNGSDGHHAELVNLVGGLPLSPGTWYRWRVSIDDEHREGWEAKFFVRRQPTAPSFGSMSG
jgi:hypothetical protein